ncbi:hypothetical protein DFH09DRAFT_1206002 [Mycena vulgaris]|nr:hypothetical protein DFH09DRAFT_1206002 [Mycena vulgaris]
MRGSVAGMDLSWNAATNCCLRGRISSRWRLSQGPVLLGRRSLPSTLFSRASKIGPSICNTLLLLYTCRPRTRCASVPLGLRSLSVPSSDSICSREARHSPQDRKSRKAKGTGHRQLSVRSKKAGPGLSRAHCLSQLGTQRKCLGLTSNVLAPDSTGGDIPFTGRALTHLYRLLDNFSSPNCDCPYSSTAVTVSNRRDDDGLPESAIVRRLQCSLRRSDSQARTVRYTHTVRSPAQLRAYVRPPTACSATAKESVEL